MDLSHPRHPHVSRHQHGGVTKSPSSLRRRFWQRIQRFRQQQQSSYASSLVLLPTSSSSSYQHPSAKMPHFVGPFDVSPLLQNPRDSTNPEQSLPTNAQTAATTRRIDSTHKSNQNESRPMDPTTSTQRTSSVLQRLLTNVTLTCQNTTSSLYLSSYSYYYDTTANLSFCSPETTTRSTTKTTANKNGNNDKQNPTIPAAATTTTTPAMTTIMTSLWTRSSCNKNYHLYTNPAEDDEIEVAPNHTVTVTQCAKHRQPHTVAEPQPQNITAPPQIQLTSFDSFISDLSWDSTTSISIELPPPMAYYAIPKHNHNSINSCYPRRCFFTGRNIAKHGLYYAGCIVQGRRTLVVFCHVDALLQPSQRGREGDDDNFGSTTTTTALPDIGTRLAKRYSLHGLSKATVWQSYNAVCHWSGLPIHTMRDVHYRWKNDQLVFYLAEVVIPTHQQPHRKYSLEISSSVQLLKAIKSLSDRYDAKVPPMVLESLTYWELIDPTTTS